MGSVLRAEQEGSKLGTQTGPRSQWLIARGSAHDGGGGDGTVQKELHHLDSPSPAAWTAPSICSPPIIPYPALIFSGVAFSLSPGLPLSWEPEIACSTVGFNLPFMPPANLVKPCCIKWEKHAVRFVAFKMH